jgi:hypothetical protein
MFAFDRESIGPVVGVAVSAVAAARGREPQCPVQRLPSDHTGYSVPNDSARQVVHVRAVRPMVLVFFT